MTLVLIGKALLLEAKQRTNGFQVHNPMIFHPSSPPQLSGLHIKGSLGENYMSLAEIRRFKSTDTRICFGHGIYGIYTSCSKHFLLRIVVFDTWTNQ